MSINTNNNIPGYPNRSCKNIIPTIDVMFISAHTHENVKLDEIVNDDVLEIVVLDLENLLFVEGPVSLSQLLCWESEWLSTLELLGHKWPLSTTV
jgi:hypothetical protein